MRAVARLLRRRPAARWFFLALAQSSLGTGAAYVALLLIAFERLDSPWAISLVLLADLLPAMLLGPFFGAVADRWSRRTCVVAADVIRAVAFIGVALVDSFGATLALAALAGTGTALFTPAALAGLPSLVEDDEVPAATSLYGAIADLGFTAGPALAALALLLGGPEEILLVNGATFAASAVILALLPFGAVEPRGETRVGAIARALIRDTREGLAIVARMRDIRVVIGASAMALFFGGLFNVAELPFASEELGTADAGYAVLVAAFGLGFVGGSLAGSKGGTRERLRGRFTSGIALFGLGLLLSGIAPSVALALPAFAVAGFGNGLLLVHERVLVQESVPDGVLARAFGVKDALASWAFGLAFFCAGALLTLTSPRELIVASGAGALLVWAATLPLLRRRRKPAAGQTVLKDSA